MPKTADIKIPKNLKFLLYGESGTGKTYTLGTAPKPMYVFDCDDGIQTLAGVPGIEYDVYKQKDEKDQTPINNLIAKANSLVDDCPFETVALDSATKLARMLQNRIITIAGRWNIGAESAENKMRIQDWGILAEDMQNIFQSFQSLDANVIITGHNRVVHNEDSGETLYLVLSEAGQSYPQKCPVDFDEIYKMDVQSRPRSGIEYRIQTESDYQWKCKSRLNYYDESEQKVVRVLEQYEENNITKLVEKVRNARDQ